MATHVDKSHVQSMHVQAYDAVRPQLRTGDLFFSSGNYTVSRLIQSMTNSPWSHVGIIVRLTEFDRVLLLESVEDAGVRFAPVSKYLSDYDDGSPYDGEIVFARQTCVGDTGTDRLAQRGTDILTRPYDRGEIGKIVARIAMGWGRHSRDNEYICSELVDECFLSAGYQLHTSAGGFITPEDVWIDGGISSLARVH